MKKYSVEDLPKLKKYDMECCSISCITEKDKVLSYLDDFLFDKRIEKIATNVSRVAVVSTAEFIASFADFLRDYVPDDYENQTTEYIYRDIIGSTEKVDESFMRCSLFQLIKSTYSDFISWYIDDYDTILCIDLGEKYNVERNFYDIELVQNFEPRRSRHVYCSYTNRLGDINNIDDIVELLVANGAIDKKEINSACSATTISEDEYLVHEIEDYRRSEMENIEEDENARFASVFPFENKKDLAAIYGNHEIVNNDIYKYTINVKIDHTGECVELLFIIGRNKEKHPEVIGATEDFISKLVLHITKTVVGYEGTIDKITKLSNYSSLRAGDSDKYSAKFFIGLGCIQDPDEAFCLDDDFDSEEECASDCDECCSNCDCRNLDHTKCCVDCNMKYDCGCSPDYEGDFSEDENSTSEKVEKESIDKENSTETTPEKYVKIPLVPVDPKAEILTLSRLIRERVELLIGGNSAIRITATCNRNDDSPIGFDHKLSIQSNTEMDL